jgi:predicted esterase
MEQPLVLATRGNPENRPLIVLHGHAEDEARSMRIAARLDPEEKYFAIAPRGPHRAGSGGSWYPHGHRDAELTVRLLEDAIGRLIEKSATPQPIVVGFSQGGGVAAALAYDSAASLDVAAAIVLAGFIPAFIDFGREAPPPALLVHGIADNRVGWQQTSHLSAKLRSIGAHVDTHRFDGGHYVPTTVLQYAAGWLNGQLL